MRKEPEIRTSGVFFIFKYIKQCNDIDHYGKGIRPYDNPVVLQKSIPNPYRKAGNNNIQHAI